MCASIENVFEKRFVFKENVLSIFHELMQWARKIIRKYLGAFSRSVYNELAVSFHLSDPVIMWYL